MSNTSDLRNTFTTSSTRQHILIVGCGIAGPVLASLLLSSHKPIATLPHITILERNTAALGSGQNIDIRGVGKHVIEKLGLTQDIKRATTGEEGVKIVDANNRIWAQFPADKTGKVETGTSDVEVLRGRLAELLSKYTEAVSKDVEARGGKGVEFISNDSIEWLHQDEKKVYARLAKAGSRTLGSRARGCLRPLCMYGAFFSTTKEEADGDWRSWYHASGGISVMLRPSGTKEKSTVLVLLADKNGTITKAIAGHERDVSAQKWLVLKKLEGIAWKEDRLKRAVEAADDLYFDTTAQVKLDRWSKGRVVLLGDAGYCASPFSGMGTTLALAGAYHLAGSLVTFSYQHELAFAQYENSMRPLVEKAQKLPPGMPHLIHPQTLWGVWLLRIFCALIHWSAAILFTLNMKSASFLALVSTASAALVERQPDGGWWDANWTGPRGYDGCPQFQHVAVLSVDGLHASDIDKWLSLKPSSNISMMLDHGYRYTGAYTTFPSDSFPGSVAQFVGANPRTTGVWYDDIWDRSFYPVSSGCKDPIGAEVEYDETIDYNLNKLFSGGINASNLPERLVNGQCQEVYPHQRIRVNTAWEVAVAAGKKTAYTDKHPSYDIMRGPSGTGLTTGYFPEINADIGDGKSYTVNVTECMRYDSLHVAAFLDWLDGNVPDNSEGSLGGTVPALFGGNFQSVSVGQKTAGYVKGSLAFTSPLQSAIEFVDASLGVVVNKLKAKNLYDQTLMIVCSKHGQAPIDPTLFNEVAPDNFTKEIGVNTTFITFDDVALVFLENHGDLATAVANLNAHKTDLHIDQIIYGQQQIDLGYGDPTKDPAVPDMIVLPTLGTIYTTSKSKIAEHGGGSDDDRHIACFAHNPLLTKKTFDGRINTTQVAPTILQVLGLNAEALQGVDAEGTQVLPGFGGFH
ncbi:2-polyprenyl-6-methoxyphenol hydroxylase-like oxidoreductase, partial [Aureobasidium melanogenum]